MAELRYARPQLCLGRLHVLIQLSEITEATYRRLEKLFWGEQLAQPLVELNGIEPSTSGLQSPRSPS